MLMRKRKEKRKKERKKETNKQKRKKRHKNFDYTFIGHFQVTSWE